MTKIAVISTKDRVYGINKSLELLGINPVKGKHVIFKPNFNTADPPPASSSMDTVQQLIIKLKEMGDEPITETLIENIEFIKGEMEKRQINN